MGAPQRHDQYGKQVLEKAFGDRFNPKPEAFHFDKVKKTAGTATIDGEIDGLIAVEIESRASKQVRGALLDLAFHPLRRKLLVIIKKYGNQITPIQAKVILGKLCRGNRVFQVVELDGRGDDPKLVEDVKRVAHAVASLRAM
jgi:hypothetical protein